MKLSTYIIISMLLSVLLHLLLLLLTGQYVLRPTLAESDPAESRRQQINVLEEAVPPREAAAAEAAAATVAEARERTLQALRQQARTLADPHKIVEIFQQERLIEPPRPQYVLERAESRNVLAPKLPEDTAAVLGTAPRPEIIEIDFSSLPPPRRALPSRPRLNKLERTASSAPLLPSLLPHGELTPGAGGTHGLQLKVGGRPQFGGPEALPGDPLSGAGDPARVALPALPTDPAEAAAPGVELPLPFDPFVTVTVQVVRDVAGAGGYFQVEITPNASSEALPDIVKDTLFILDHSTSISVPKLNQFKAATREALAYLNPADRFNVVSFTNAPRTLYPGYTAVTPASRQQADRYIAALQRGGMTDVFGGVAPFVEKSNADPDRPLNIFLLTDGQSTVNIHRPSDFLRQIVGMNPGNVSIFPFSAGRQANRQLLDFLGYLNRGSKSHVDDLPQLRGELAGYISRHSSLIIMDMEYTVSGQVSENVFPRTLPHLYRNATLRLWGRFQDIDDELVLSLSGRDAGLRRRELIFRRRYAECAAGDKELPSVWAGQKILYLLALKTCTDHAEEAAAYESEIANLTRRYGVYAPY